MHAVDLTLSQISLKKNDASAVAFDVDATNQSSDPFDYHYLYFDKLLESGVCIIYINIFNINLFLFIFHHIYLLFVARAVQFVD